MSTTEIEQLRQDIHDGLNSGEPTSWNPQEIKQEGRKRRALRTNTPAPETTWPTFEGKDNDIIAI